MDMYFLLWFQNLMLDDYGRILGWLCFIMVLMLIDMITGFIQAYINHDLKSGKMSNGILKKFALLLVLITIVPLTILLPDLISTGLIVTVYGLEVMNELVSIMENAKKLGIATSVFDPIMKRLNASNPQDDKKEQDNKEEK
ncbi:phage holin family protein [Enterococcus sp. AZ102]|uniref:phage holin family protein n=1 Tax=Enterococcus sp. AZ102 TaxID=2774865 RepID=UPI003F2847D2